MASFASLLVPGVSIPQPDTSWISGAADTIVGGIDKYKQNKSFNKLADLIGQQPQGQQAAAQPGLMTQPQAQSFAAPVMPVDRSAPQGDTYQPFIDTVRTKVTNPYGLAAVAATGRAESGWSGANANRTWSDPSQSGQAGTSGGILSWRGPRLANLQAYAASKGEQGNGSPQTQGEFLLQENPQLIEQLNSAKSPEEAAGMMANAWRFAGYDQQGGEAARRRAMTLNYAAQFRDQPNSAAAAIEAQAPGGMGSPMTDQAFDGRFGETALPGQVAQGLGGLASALTDSNAAAVMPQQGADPVQTGAVQRDPLSTANAQPISAAPAQASAGFTGVPGVQPIPRGGVPIELIQTMLRDPNLREIGVKLWAQNVQGPNNAEPWQFVQGPDGTLLRANQSTGAIEPIGNFGKKTTDLPNSYREYQLAKQDGFTGNYEQWEKQKIPNGPSVTVNNESGSGAFYKKADELRAGTVVDAATAGNDAQRRLIQVDQLDNLLKNVDTGGLAAAKQMAGEWGINTEGLTDIQATAALINQMVPSQRPPGSGTMSDADLALFKQSLPRIINQPGGNELIIRTMRGIANYDQQIGDIANQVLNREITPAEGQKRMRAVENPLARFDQALKAPAGGKGGRNGGVARPTTDAEYNALPSGALFIDPDDGQQYRKP